MVRKAILLLIICASTVSGANAQERFALVIGNAAYETISELETPIADSALIAANLEILGFEVTYIQDANLVEMKRSIGRYGIRIQEAPENSTGLIYFAGHGVNAFGDNFLLPVDVNVETAEDLDFVAIDVDSLAFTSEAHDIQNLIIIDCCTENPLAGVPDMGGNGLYASAVSDGNFIAYSTPANGILASGDVTFAQSFVDAIQIPGGTIENAIDQTGDQITAAYGDAQTPFWSSSLVDPFVFVAIPQLSDEEKEWLVAQDNSDTSTLMLFIERYPTGEFSGEAKRLLLNLLSAELGPETETETAAPSEELSPPEEVAVADPVVESTVETIEQVEEVVSAVEDVVSEEPELPTDLNVARVVRYTQPLTEGSPDILGQSLEKLVTGKPLFSPVEDLPEIVWKDKSCSDCHQWTAEDLCVQAQFYMGEAGAESLVKEHPYGGSFKQNLLTWAQGDCQQ